MLLDRFKSKSFSSHEPWQTRSNGGQLASEQRRSLLTMQELPTGVTSLSRQHALVCSGAEQFFLQRFPELAHHDEQFFIQRFPELAHHDALPPINILSRLSLQARTTLCNVLL